jgi:anti-sigma factor RsiW
MSDEQLNKLMDRARRERAPRVDVTDRVMAQVRLHPRERQRSLRPLMWVAAAAAAAAAIAAPVGLDLWELLSDPLLGLASEAVWWLL